MNRVLFATTIALATTVSCVPEVGTQGPTGPIGPTGPAGQTAGYSPDCPQGYTKDVSETKIILCKQGVDEVVKVGRKGTAFWIDRYEASIWSDENGGGQQYGTSTAGADFPASFPANGQVVTPLYALSRAGVRPSASTTWFQANEACRASGKRLPTTDEWFAAARGTQDPGDNMGTGGACVTKGSIRNTGQGTNCVSFWGAQDMVGNLDEATAEWQAGPGSGTTTTMPWPAGYGGDSSVNVGSSAFVGMTPTAGMPSIVSRGCGAARGVEAGLFYIDLSASPTSADLGRGFRCIIPR